LTRCRIGPSLFVEKVEGGRRAPSRQRRRNVVAQLLPYLLRELACYAAALRPLSQEISSWKKPWRG
jgi:hypothetical protein